MMRLIVYGATLSLCVATAHQIVSPPAPKWIYNPSPSAPIGWYELEPEVAILRGSKVAAFAPAEARKLGNDRGYLPTHVPIIKSVWAIGGDRVCAENGVITAPNRPDIYAAAQDGLGRKMPVLQGCFVLKADEVFLVSTDVQTSWDSRYFGPVRQSDVLGVVQHYGEGLGPFRGFGGRARASGVEGKIKGGSAPLGLFPCLHIIFGGTPLECRGAPFATQWCGIIEKSGGAPCQIERCRAALK